MSTSSVIGSMQSALDCAGKCDCCQNLQAQINALKQQIANIKPVNELALKNSIQASLQPGIASAVAGAAVVVANKLQPQIDDLSRNLSSTKTALSDAKLAEDLRAAKMQSQFNSDLQAAIKRQAQLDAVALQNATANAVDPVARAKATSAITEAATASKAAIDTSNEVSGLRGIVNGIGSKVNALGEAIGKLETAVGNAITNAAKAIGISEEALSTTAKWAGRVGELFNLVGTIFSLIENTAILETLGARIDAVENGVTALGNSVSVVLGKLLGLQNRIGANESLTAQARAIALDAKGIGEAANLKAGAAQVTAARAQGAAGAAQLTADGAVRNAAIANENATTAYKQGIKAEGIGEQAKRIAGDALGKAGVALTTALTAIALYQGVKSLRGLQGIPGIPGRQGERGFQGIQGIQGVPGRDGITTVVQIPGVPGKDGKDGKDGRNGFPGRDGRDMGQAEVADLKAFIAAQHQQTRGILLSALANIRAAVGSGFATVSNIVNTAANGASLALLNIINNKLGQQVTGGISGLVTAVAKNTYIEKALAVLTFAATIHNALMLSNNLGMTLFSIIDSILGLVLPKGLDGTPINIQSTLNKTVEALITSAIGEENYTHLKQDWALANRIYQSTANVFNSVTNLANTVISGLEILGGTMGKVGNALKKWGVVGEKAYEFFNPQPNFHNKFFIFLENANNEANTIQNVVQVPVSITQAKTDLDNSVKDLKDAVSQKPGTTPGIEKPEAKDEKDKFDLGKTISQSLDIALDDLFNAND